MFNGISVKILFLIIVQAVVLPFVSPVSGQVDFTSSNLPIIKIDTHGQSIPYDNPRIRADMCVIDNGPGNINHVTDSCNNYSGLISMEIHGSSSAGWAKKSYAIETENPDSSNNNVPLLGMPPENDWILYAPYYDRSLMRNVLVYRLSSEMGWYAPRTRYFELVLNGKYQGVYVLVEKIKRDKNRVKISKLTPDDNAGDSLTGGYIFKVDKEQWKPGFDSKYPPFPGSDQTIRYQYCYPKADKITPEQQNYISTYVWHFEDIMAGGHINDPVNGYPAILNVKAFIDYFIVNELSKNVDGYRLSSYLYKKRDSKGGKILAGPVWDYNFSFGNVAYYNAQYYTGWELLYFFTNEYFKHHDAFQAPFWWNSLIHDTLFVQQTIQRWHELRDTLITPDRFHRIIDAIADTLDEAKDRNFTIWIGPGDPKLPSDGWFPPSDPIDNFHTYLDAINYLKSWIDQRIAWMDDNFEDLLTSLYPPPEVNYNFSIDQNKPNPVSDHTTFTYRIPYHYYVQLNIYNTTGQRIASMVNEYQDRGEHSVDWSPRGLPAGIYIYELRAGPYSDLTSGIHRAIKKLVIVK